MTVRRSTLLLNYLLPKNWQNSGRTNLLLFMLDAHTSRRTLNRIADMPMARKFVFTVHKLRHMTSHTRPRRCAPKAYLMDLNFAICLGLHLQIL